MSRLAMIRNMVLGIALSLAVFSNSAAGREGACIHSGWASGVTCGEGTCHNCSWCHYSENPDCIGYECDEMCFESCDE
jgi:hypothetical protein